MNAGGSEIETNVQGEAQVHESKKPSFEIYPATDIPFASVDLSATINPVAAIVGSSEYAEASRFFKSSPSWNRALISELGQALLYSLIRNQKPQHIVEVGSYKGATTETFARALHANGHGTAHTIGPYDDEHFLPVFECWPQELRSYVRYYPVNSMDFFTETTLAGLRYDLVLVDGNHDYEFALFDIQCAARRMVPGGFIVIDNITQAGPYFAAVDFLAAHPEWQECSLQPRQEDITRAFDRDRTGIPGTDFMVLRAPSNYLVGARPSSFGEIPWPHREVKGLRFSLAEPTQNAGTLHVDCILRGFSHDRLAEVSTKAALTMADGASGELKLTFETPLATNDPFDRYRIEPWLVWTGQDRLKLHMPPEVF